MEEGRLPSYEMASIRKEKKNKVYLNLSGQKRSED